jgi:hypothetical protein
LEPSRLFGLFYQLLGGRLLLRWSWYGTPIDDDEVFGNGIILHGITVKLFLKLGFRVPGDVPIDYRAT